MIGHHTRPFPSLQAKKHGHKSEKQQQNNEQKHSKCLISMKLTGIQDKLSDQFDSRRAQFPVSRGLSRRGKMILPRRERPLLAGNGHRNRK